MPETLPMQRRIGRGPRRGDALTEREMQVLVGVVDGLTNQEIGKRLYLTEDTVKTHLRRTFSKLGVDSRVDAVIASMQRGLVPCACGRVTHPETHAVVAEAQAKVVAWNNRGR